MTDLIGILKDWLKFSEDVQPSDACGAEWLQMLQNKTNGQIDTLEKEKQLDEHKL
jgi:hypothetical protein